MMETYYAYLRWCADFNERNLIDPAHDQMEWNHTLPQCIFGDQPIGQWLTLKQHAIASALQTLAFKTNCLWGGMLKYLPDNLYDLSIPFYSKMCSDSIAVFSEEELNRRSKHMRETNLRNYSLNLHPMQKTENQDASSARAKLWVQKMIEEGTHPSLKEGASERITKQNLQRVEEGIHNFLGEGAGKRVSDLQLRRVEEGTHYWKTEEHSRDVSARFKGAKHWVNEKGEKRFQHEKPEGEWQNGRKWRNSK